LAQMINLDSPVRWPWVVLGIVASLTLLIGGFVHYQAEAERIRLEKYQELAAIGKLKTDQIKEWRDEHIRDLAGFSDNPFFKKGLLEWLRDRNNNALRAELERSLILEKEKHGYTDALLVDIDGGILLSAKQRADVMTPNEKSVIETALSRRTIVLGDLYRSSQGIEALDAASPVLDEEGRTVAAIVTKTDAGSLLYPLVNLWPTPSKTAETLLVRRDGDQVLYLNDLRHRPDSVLNLRIPLTRVDLPAVQAVLGTQGIFRGKDYRGVEVLADLRPVPQSPWFMVAKVDANEILAEIGYRGGVIAFFAVLFVLLSASVTAYGYRGRQAGLYKNLYQLEREQREAQEQFRTTLYSIGDGVIITNADGLVKGMNPVAESLTGWSEKEADGRSIEEIFNIINEESRNSVENPIQKVLREGVVAGLANHTVLIARDRVERPISDSAAPIRDESGLITGVVLVFRDQTQEREAAKQLAQAHADLERKVMERTAELGQANEKLILEIEERKRSESIMQARLRLMNFASSHSLDELLQATLEEAEELTGSVIGFYHFVDVDQKKLRLQAWSAKTLAHMCTAEGKGRHYDIDRAGVWVDCVHQRKPVIHNDYAALPHRRGMPVGHADVIRELVVPVFRDDRVVAILGVGNKPVDYAEGDIETVSLLADLVWDIAERKRAEEALRERERFLSSIFESIQDGITILDSDLNIIRTNPTIERWYPHAKPLFGKKCFQAYHGADKPCQECPVAQTLETGKAVCEVVPRKGVEGNIEGWLELYAFPLLAHGSERITGAIEYFRDISDRKKAEDALRAGEERHRAELEQRIEERTSELAITNERLTHEIAERKQTATELERSNAELQQFAYVASHDLQEPLRMISSYVRLLQRRYLGKLDQDADDFIGYAVDGAKRMRRLIDDLLQYSRVGTHGKPLEPVQCEVLLNQALANLKMSIEDSHGRVTYDPLPTLIADSTQLMQLFQNLIENALKFRSDAAPLIHVSARRDGGHWHFSVRDNGIGIDPQYADRVFVIFQRLHGRDEYPGTGLGLAICKKIVERHGGRIWVEPESGAGATFCFTIPENGA
jgi:PAS domain S-box-containing protein